MQNILKELVLQAMTENSNANAAILQALQCTTEAAAVNQPAAMQNGQNNDVKTIHSILYSFSMVDVV